LFIFKITVDEGPKLKRWHPMSRGRAYPIIKRCAHIALIISDGQKAVEAKKSEVKAPAVAQKSSGVAKEVKKTTAKKTVKKPVKKTTKK
jgi:hypothetical protein